MIILSVESSLKYKGQENLLSNLKEVKTPNIELEKVIDNSQHSTSLIILFSFNIKIYWKKYKTRKIFKISYFVDRKISRQVGIIWPMRSRMLAYWRKSYWVSFLYLNKYFPVLIFKFLFHNNTFWGFFKHLLLILHETLQLFILCFSQIRQSGGLHCSVSNNAIGLIFFVLIYKFLLSFLLWKYFFLFSGVNFNWLSFIFFNCLIIYFWLLFEFISVA